MRRERNLEGVPLGDSFGVEDREPPRNLMLGCAGIPRIPDSGADYGKQEHRGGSSRIQRARQANERHQRQAGRASGRHHLPLPRTKPSSKPRFSIQSHSVRLRTRRIASCRKPVGASDHINTRLQPDPINPHGVQQLRASKVNPSNAHQALHSGCLIEGEMRQGKQGRGHCQAKGWTLYETTRTFEKGSPSLSGNTPVSLSSGKMFRNQNGALGK